MTSIAPSSSALSATRDTAIAAGARYLADGAYARDLARRVALRTESDRGAAGPELNDYLASEALPVLSGLGFEGRIVPNPDPRGGPFLIARRVESESLPTVLTYAHGDVVSGQEAQWRTGLSPWQLKEEDDRFYGRGTADNKGQHTVSLGALAATLAAREGRLGYNITLLMEMGEEAGSPGLEALCRAERDALAADCFIACDGPRVSADQPTLFLGSRGAVNFTLRYAPRERAFHSGNWGGVLANPATVVANAVACLVDGRGRILVPELKPDSVPANVSRALADIRFGGGVDDPAMSEGWGEPGLTPAERLVGFNTIEVLALGGGNAERPVNAIPRDAVAHCQLRFVVGTPWERLAEIVRAHLDAAGFGAVEVSVTLAGAATRLDVDHPWVHWARQSIALSTGKPVAVLPNLAGSLPNDVFAGVLGLPTLWVPHSYPACGQHAPNEHMLKSVAHEGLAAMAGLWWDLGEADAPWSAPRAA